MNKDLVQQTRLRIEQADRIMVTAHTRPDGDAIGSVLALGLALQAEGKKVQMVLADGVPNALKFLPGSEQIANKPKNEVDMVIVLDCGNLERVGNVLDDVEHIDVNIDHHPDNSRFAEVNIITPKAVSVSQMLAEMFPELGLEITPQVASNLLAGLITDTIGFKTENMHPDVLRLAADLFEAGANLPKLYHHAVAEKTFEAARYIGTGLSQLVRQNGMVWTTLSLNDRKEANYPGRDDADLVNILSAIDSADVALIFIEQHNSQVKVSWRTRSVEIDVSRAARHFGGGGHRAAAGAMIKGSLTDVQADVLNITRQLLFED
jgi:phosphoesterase RecJ-like protein